MISCVVLHLHGNVFSSVIEGSKARLPILICMEITGAAVDDSDEDK